MRVTELMSVYGEGILDLIDTTRNRMRLVQKYLVEGDKETSFDRHILIEVNDILDNLAMAHETLASTFMRANSITKAAKSEEKNHYFMFDDNGDVSEISEEEASHLEMFAEEENEHYENYDI